MTENEKSRSIPFRVKRAWKDLNKGSKRLLILLWFIVGVVGILFWLGDHSDKYDSWFYLSNFDKSLNLTLVNEVFLAIAVISLIYWLTVMALLWVYRGYRK